jgi:hypothetical protein
VTDRDILLIGIGALLNESQVPFDFFYVKLSGNMQRSYLKIKPEFYDSRPDRVHAIITIVAHNTIASFCRYKSNFQIPCWDEADEVTRIIHLDVVRAILSTQQYTPEHFHTHWRAALMSDGWELGPELDHAAKKHPLMVPYPELPQAEQIRYQLFIQTVRCFQAPWVNR